MILLQGILRELMLMGVIIYQIYNVIFNRNGTGSVGLMKMDKNFISLRFDTFKKHPCLEIWKHGDVSRSVKK